MKFSEGDVVFQRTRSLIGCIHSRMELLKKQNLKTNKCTGEQWSMLRLVVYKGDYTTRLHIGIVWDCNYHNS